MEEIMRQKQKVYFESIGKSYFNLDPYLNEAINQINASIDPIYADNLPCHGPDDMLEEVYSYAIRVAEKLMFVQL